MRGRRPSIAIALLIGIACSAVASARQDPPPADRGQVQGLVVDAAGKPLPDVTVAARNIRGGAPVPVKTGADGRYTITLPLGIYLVAFSKPGFAPLERPGIVIVASLPMDLDATLRPCLDCAAPQSRGSSPAPSPLAAGEVLVRIATPHGNIDVAVDTAHAPITAGNFLKYVDAALYDGGRFYRVTRPDNYTAQPPNRPPMQLIQGGIDPAKRSQAFPAIPLERTSVTGIKHVAGVVSMARGGPDSATSEFFILLDDQPSLDFGGKRFDDGQGAAAFGRVVSGLDVVRTINQQGPLQDQNRQYLATPVAITSIKRAR